MPPCAASCARGRQGQKRKGCPAPNLGLGGNGQEKAAVAKKCFIVTKVTQGLALPV